MLERCSALPLTRTSCMHACVAQAMRRHISLLALAACVHACAQDMCWARPLMHSAACMHARAQETCGAPWLAACGCSAAQPPNAS
jgi:hypothetical protein